MKICDHCGERNWNPQEKCSVCDRPMSSYPQQLPECGEKGEGFIVKKKRLHDEYGWTETHGD